MTNSDGNKTINYAVSSYLYRSWNKPPHYGFSKDVLYMIQDEKFFVGDYELPMIHFKANIYRDEYAAQHALNSIVGQRCQKDMANGFMYGSPACEQARLLDQTYNNYDLTAEANMRSLPDSQTSFNHKAYDLFNHLIYGYTVNHSHKPNDPGKASLIVKRDPYTGASNMTFVRAYETVIAHNVRSIKEPFTRLFLFPLHAGHTMVHKNLNKTYGGVSEAKCFVGPNAVYTFDGGILLTVFVLNKFI